MGRYIKTRHAVSRINPPHLQPKRSSRSIFVVIVVFIVFAVLVVPVSGLAADIEGDAWPELDIWIKMDKAGKNRIFILNSYTEEPNYQYQETALGISWDQRFHKNWSWRLGIRYIWKQVEPPDKNETREVLDLKWFYDLGRGWLLTDRNRLDLRHFSGDSDSSFRYRNRVQIEKAFPVFSRNWTGFASFEMYYDSRFNKWGQRNRVIGGVSVPIVDWLSVDVFGAYHKETEPRDESGSALGIAVGFYF